MKTLPETEAAFLCQPRDLCKPVHCRFSKMIHLKLNQREKLFVWFKLADFCLGKLRREELTFVDLNLMIALDLNQAAVNSYF